MNIKINKCIKVTLNKCLNMDIKEIKQIIRDFQYMYSKAYNMATNYLYIWDTNSMNFKNLYDAKINDKELLGKSKGAWIENRMNEIIKGANSGNIAQARQDVCNKYNKSKKDGLLKGSVSLPTYKRDSKVIIHNVSYKLRNHNGYFVDIGLFNNEKKAELGIGRVEFQIDKIDNNKKATINKIINGEYKQGYAQISISKKGKIELIISFGFEKEIEKELDINRILGIDLGITNIATMSVYNSEKEEFDYFSYKNNMIDGKELIAFRQKYYNLRKDMSIASKYVGEGRIGHGYKARMKPVDKIRDKVANFSDTANHKYSRYIVDFAVKNNCGVIQMEDLSGSTSNVHERFLKEWSYYDLQNKIEYKAKEQGIKVIKINPKYTSKRCNKCGNIHIENRDCKNDQAKFECKICGHKDNADVNASRNIAIPYIDKIIETYIKDNKLK